MIRTTQPPKTPPLRHANARAQAITGRDYVSFSQLSMMRRCSQQFLFQYVQQLTPEFVPSSLKFGSAVHAAIEAHFQARLEGQRISAKGLSDLYRRSWAEPDSKGAPLRLNKSETEEGLHEMAGRMLQAFLESPASQPAGEVVAVEEMIRATLDPALPDIVSRVDVVVQCGTGLQVNDFKTSRSKWTEAKAMENGEQLQLYRRLARPMADHGAIEARFVVLTKQKTPAVQVFEVPDGGDDGARLVEGMKQVWTAIEAGNYYPNPSPMNCATCPFKGRCPAFGASRTGS